MGAMEGDGGTSRLDERRLRPVEPVFRLSWLGFRLIAGMTGLMKDGDEGSDERFEEEWWPPRGGCMERPFMFRAFLGEGEVTGRDRLESLTVRAFIVLESPPKLVAGKEVRGIRFTGESGDDEGEGSENDPLSVVKVVVGDESVDSEFCVEVLS